MRPVLVLARLLSSSHNSTRGPVKAKEALAVLVEVSENLVDTWTSLSHKAKGHLDLVVSS